MRTLHLLTVEVDGLLVPLHVGFQSEAGGALGALEAAGPGAVEHVEREQHGEGVLVDVLLQLLSTLEHPPAEATGQPLGQG